MSRGNPNGAAGVTPHARDGKVRGDRRTCAAARSAGIAVEVVRILRLPAAGADGRDTRGELVHVRLADDDGAGVLQTPHLECIATRVKCRQRDRTCRGRHFYSFVIVFDDDGNTVQRPPHSPRPALSVKLIGGREGLRVERDHRVECRTFLVVCRDPGQVEFHELAGRDRTGLHRRLQLGDGLFHYVVCGLSLRSHGREPAGQDDYKGCVYPTRL